MTEAPASGVPAPTSVQNAPERSIPGTNQQQKRVYEPGKAPSQAVEPNQDPFKGTRHRVKIDGQEREVDYDTLIRDYQTSQAAQRRFQEASKESARAKELEKRLENGDIKWLTEKLGKDRARELFEDHLIGELEYEALSPAEKRSMELENENKSLKSEKEREKAELERRRYDHTVSKAHDELDVEISEALSAEGMKPTPRLVMRILDEIEANLATKDRRIPAGQAKDKAIQSIYQDIAEYLPQLPIEKALALFPKEFLDRVRNYEVEQVLGERQAKRIKVTPGKSDAPKATAPQSQSDWFAAMEKKLAKKR